LRAELHANPWLDWLDQPLLRALSRGKQKLTGLIRKREKMAPLLRFIAMIIDLYIWVVIISAVMSWLIAFDVVNRRNRVVYMVADSLHKLTEPALRPIRRYMPDLGGVDISPIVLILILIFLRDVVIWGWLI
jgi:YggT family protein